MERRISDEDVRLYQLAMQQQRPRQTAGKPMLWWILAILAIIVVVYLTYTRYRLVGDAISKGDTTSTLALLTPEIGRGLGALLF